MSTNNSVPGMIYPTQQGYNDGAGNPRDSAMAAMKSAAESQANANKALAGGKRRKCRGGAINAPQMQMLYQPQGGPGTNPNNQIAANTQTSTQMAANRVYDADASNVSGGSRRKRKGGNPDWHWGCKSGGKSYRKSRKTRKSRKSRKYRKR